MSFDNVHHVFLVLVTVQLDAVCPRVTFELRLRLRTYDHTALTLTLNDTTINCNT